MLPHTPILTFKTNGGEGARLYPQPPEGTTPLEVQTPLQGIPFLHFVGLFVSFEVHRPSEGTDGLSGSSENFGPP